MKLLKRTRTTPKCKRRRALALRFALLLAIGSCWISGCGQEAPETALWAAAKQPMQKISGAYSQEKVAGLHHEDKWQLPSQWDNRRIGRTASIKNQGDLGTCWAFAALGALEILELPQNLENFSVDHLALNHGFTATMEEGGNFNMALSYLAGWKGPVWEADDPYADGVTNPEAAVRAHLQEAQLLENDRYAIKEAVLQNGSVQSSLYADEAILYADQSTMYYAADTCAYYYDGPVQYNHDVLIIGWDDTYSRDNFAITPPGDGAFICQNSWGETFGEQGFFYVSYYDTTIGQNTITYSRLDNPENYDHLYQHDLLGWTGQVGYEQESAWGANLFTATGQEEISAVSFYTTDALTSYEIYIDLEPQVSEGQIDFSSRQLVARGSQKNAGYYTVDLSKPLALESGQSFAVLIYVNTPGASMPLAAEYQGSAGAENAQVNAGESYISENGTRWQDCGGDLLCNICLKALTNDCA